MRTRKSLILLPICVATLATAPFAFAQSNQSGQSVANAARKAREQQKSEPKSAKVYTDDDLANLKGQISIVGNVQPAAAPAADNAAAAAKPAAPSNQPVPVKDEAYWRKRFAEARRALTDDTREADVLQREYGLKQTQFYSNPNVALREQYSRKDLDDTLAELNAKKVDVDKDNQAISNLQDELRQSGGDAGWANEPTSNGQPTSSDTDSPSQAPASAAPTAAAPASTQTEQQGARADSGASPASGADQTQAPAASQQP
jgi:hypothetical protein